MSNTQDAVERAMDEQNATPALYKAAKLALAALDEEAVAYEEPLAHVIEARDALRKALSTPITASVGEPAQLLTKAKITALIAVAQAASAVAQTSGISIDDMANLSGAL